MREPLVVEGINLDDLVTESHQTALEKGWWEEGIAARPIADQIANFHAEVSEAWECYRAHQMETVVAHNTGKPEGFWVEIADVMIRLADTAGAYKCVLVPGITGFDTGARNSVARAINNLHLWLCNITVSTRTSASGISSGVLSVCLRNCIEFAKSMGAIDALREAITLKLAYNKTRPHRHGNKKA